MKTLITQYRNNDLKNYEKNEILEAIFKEVKGCKEYLITKYLGIPNTTKEDLESVLNMTIVKCVDYYNVDGAVSFKTFFSKCGKRELDLLLRDNTRDKRVFRDEEGNIIKPSSIEAIVDGGGFINVTSNYDYADIELNLLLDKLNLTYEQRFICDKLSKGWNKIDIARALNKSLQNICYNIKALRKQFTICLT
ncbi:MAG: hypothetical protein ACRDBY_14105 [Cetobacterium sp.]